METGSNKLWMKFFGGLCLFVVLLSIYIYGLIEIKSYLEQEILLGEIPNLLSYSLALVSVIVMVLTLNITTGKTYRELQRRRKD